MFTIRQALIGDLLLVRDVGIRTYQAHFGELWHYKEELDAFLAQDFAVEALEKRCRIRKFAGCWVMKARIWWAMRG